MSSFYVAMPTAHLVPPLSRLVFRFQKVSWASMCLDAAARRPPLSMYLLNCRVRRACHAFLRISHVCIFEILHV